MENQEERLKQEIQQESERTAEKIVSRARRDCEKLRSKAQEANLAQRNAVLSDAQEEATRRCRKLELDQEYAVQRAWLSGREECIDELFQKVLHRADALTGKDKEASYANLAKEAVKNFDGEEQICVHVRPDDAALVTVSWLNGMFSEKIQFTIVEDAKMKPGLIFTTPDQRLTFDNTYATRLRLMRTELRRRLANL